MQVSPVYLPCISPASRLVPPLAGLSAFELHAIGKLAVAHGIGEGQLCLASVPHPPPATPLGAIPYSRDTVYIIRSGEVTYPSL